MDSILLEMAESWELEKGWMIGFIIIENQPGFTDEMYLMAHHLVLDHIAVSLLMRHVFADAGYLMDSDRSVATEPMSLRQYSLTTSEAQCTADDSQWTSLINGASNEPKSFAIEGHSNHYSISLNETDTNELVQAADAANVNLLEILVTVLSFIWRRNAIEQSVTELDLYIETSGRDLPLDDQDVSDVIGWMTLFYPLDKSAINHADVYETLKGIKNSLRLHKEDHYQYLNWYFQQYNSCPTKGAENATCLINYLGDSDSLMEADGYTINACKKRFLRDENSKRAFDIELNAYLSNKQLHLDWNVAENLNGVVIEDLSQDMVDEMISLANRLLESGGGPVYTPSDFSSASLSQDDLDSILRDID